MNDNEKARVDGGTPTQATDDGSLDRDHLHPQSEHTTIPAVKQAKRELDLADEIKIIDALIAPYDRKQYRRQSRKVRELIYNDGMRLVCSFPFSSDANQHARKALSRMLRT